MNELNTRQWDLYNFLKSKGDNWTHLKEIAILLDYGSINSANFNNTLARRLITQDIQVLNESNVIQKIIIKGNRGIKLANEAEIQDFIDKRRISLLNALKRHYKLEKKAHLNGQTRFVFNKERDTIEAFIK